MSLENNLTAYNHIIQELNTINNLRADWDDKLIITSQQGVPSSAKIAPHGFSQAFGRTVKNIFFSGYNRKDVVNHVQNLAMRTQNFVSDTQQFNALNYYEKRELLSALKGTVKSLEELEEHYLGFLGKDTPESDNITAAKQTIACLEKDFLLPEKPENFANTMKEYNTSINSSEIPANRRKSYEMDWRHKPINVLTLAKTAKDRTKTWKFIATLAAGAIAVPFVTVPLVTLSCFKWVVWNPIEWYIKGKVTTANPLAWAVSNFILSSAEYFPSYGKDILDAYAKQMLNPADKELFSEEHIDGFCELAKHLKGSVDLSHFYVEDASAIPPTGNSVIPVSQAQFNRIYEAIKNNSRCKKITINTSITLSQAEVIKQTIKGDNLKIVHIR